MGGDLLFPFPFAGAWGHQACSEITSAGGGSTCSQGWGSPTVLVFGLTWMYFIRFRDLPDTPWKINTKHKARWQEWADTHFARICKRDMVHAVSGPLCTPFSYSVCWSPGWCVLSQGCHCVGECCPYEGAGQSPLAQLGASWRMAPFCASVETPMALADVQCWRIPKDVRQALYG